ncbi:MAG: HNH endonuclease [Ignavibacterium sp.]|nr:HNH endonuclease [Ignavibacterium sp.]
MGYKLYDHRIIPIEKPQIITSNTNGWFIQIFNLKKIEGGIELWLDLFPNVDRPVLSICYWCKSLERINKVAYHSINNFNDDHPYKISQKQRGNVVLEKTLAKKYFDRFLIESYDWQFFIYYFSEHLDNGITDSLKKKVSKKIEWLMRSTVSALEIKSNEQAVYPSFENRKIVAQHIRRERSKKLADAIKLRDGFSCRVCDFNFQDTYGEVGRGFAEAHHIIALSKLTNQVHTKPADLISVCSNCHRMLHRMEGQMSDFKTLRKRLKNNLLHKYK